MSELMYQAVLYGISANEFHQIASILYRLYVKFNLDTNTDTSLISKQRNGS